MTDTELCRLLDENAIPYRRFDHPAVFTCDEAARLVPSAAIGVHTKNLFLRDKKGRRHWLLVTTCATAVDLKALAPVLGADNLSLASPERLHRHLGVTPGAVTLLALVNDREGNVSLVVDRSIWEAAAWRSHPLVNTATLVIPWAGIERFIAVSGHEAGVVDVPVRSPQS